MTCRRPPDRTGRHPRCGSGARATLIHTGAVAAAVPERHEVLAGVVPGPGADQFLGRPRYWGWNRPGFGSTALRWGFGRWHNEDPARPAVGSSRARPSHSATASAGRPTSRVAGPDADQGQHGSGQPLKGLTSRSGEPLPNSGSTAAEPPLDAVHGTAHRSLLPKAVGFSQPPTDTRVGSLMRLFHPAETLDHLPKCTCRCTMIMVSAGKDFEPTARNRHRRAPEGRLPERAAAHPAGPGIHPAPAVGDHGPAQGRTGPGAPPGPAPAAVGAYWQARRDHLHRTSALTLAGGAPSGTLYLLQTSPLQKSPKPPDSADGDGRASA
jgi:hypothetical protein